MSELVDNYRGRRTSHRPIWFMRQAGRSLPEYRLIREGIGMLEACQRPELVAEITAQPVRRHHVDAGILYSDIVVPVRLAGVDVDIVPGRGPVLAAPLRSRSDVERLPQLDPAALDVIVAAARASVEALGSTPLIGFAGAPFTVASYLVEGAPSRDFRHVRAMMAEDPQTWNALLDWVADVSAQFLRAQVTGGAQAVQLFDSWVGNLDVDTHRHHVLPHTTQVFAAVADLDVPRIVFGTGTGHLLPDLCAAGADAVGIDAQTSLAQAAALLPGVPLQGNIDPAILTEDWPTVERHVRDVIAAGRELPGHVVNLGHGVPPTTDPDVLTRIVELVHTLDDEER